MKKRIGLALVILVVGTIALVVGKALLDERSADTSDSVADIDDFIDLLDPDRAVVSVALNKVESNRHAGNAIMLLECLRLLRNPNDVQQVLTLLQQQTGQKFLDQGQWYDWIWRQEYKPHPNYADFKARLYERMDPRFPEYFADTASATIRLDEILWGGVVRDGIPPLKNPKMLSAADAIYLEAIREAGLYDEIWQAFAVLLPVRTVGVMGDERTYEYVCALRAVTSNDGMTADFYPFAMDFLGRTATRIVNEVRGINRVVYDVTSKPPGTIEWE